MFSVALNAPVSRVVAAPRTANRSVARPARSAVALRATEKNGAVTFTSEDFDAGAGVTTAVVEREAEEPVEKVASIPEPVVEQPVVAESKPEPVAFTTEPASSAIVEGKASPISELISAFSSRRAIETINGRVAMLGFVTAMSAESAEHVMLGEQFAGALVPVALITVASLAPKLRKDPQAPKDGITEDAEEFFVFKSSAEMFNGRAAMVGITAWGLIEAVGGVPML